MKGCKSKFIGALGLVVVLTLSFGLYYRWSQIQEVSAVNVIRKAIPRGHIFWMAHEGDYGVGVSIAENNPNQSALYLYDTQGTLTDFSDDTYTIIDQVDGKISHITFQDNYITWLDNTGRSSRSPLTLKAYNITTSTTTIISDQIADYIYGRDGNKIVYQYVVPNGRNIAMYDLSTQQTTIICDAPGVQRSPRIKNNIIVWEDGRNPQTRQDIYLYNLNTQTETLVAEDVADYFALPTTNGEFIVYQTQTPQNKTNFIKKYHIPSETTSIIASSNNENEKIALCFTPNFSNYIVWLYIDPNNLNNHRMYLHHLDTSQNIVLEDQNLYLLFPLAGPNFNDDHLVYVYEDKVKGWDLSQQQHYYIRTIGSTYSIYLHPTENTLLMCSKGTGINPNEWDISYAVLP